MIKSIMGLLVSVLIFITTSCVEPKQVEDLAKRVDNAQKQVNDLQDRLETATKRIVSLEDDPDPYETVILNASKPGDYERIDTSSGMFLLVLEDASPYLDGYKLKLTIGNVMSGTYSKAVLKIDWGGRGYRDFPLTEDIRQGAWNHVTVTLAPAKAEDLHFIGVKMETRRVSLRR